jgi:hypothetical protein
LRTRVALRAPAGGTHELRTGLVSFDAWAGTIDQECAKDKYESNYDGQKKGSKGHKTIPRLRHGVFEALPASRMHSNVKRRKRSFVRKRWSVGGWLRRRHSLRKARK